MLWMNNDAVKMRFATSPAGVLHPGCAYTALCNRLPACLRQGVFLQRIENTDPDRGTDDYAESLQHDLQWPAPAWREVPGIFDQLFQRCRHPARPDQTRFRYPCCIFTTP
jgi:glutamyl/glutaminyl-tRNA synthetase